MESRHDGDTPCSRPTACPTSRRSRPPPPTTTSCAAPSPTSAATGARSRRSKQIAEAAGVTPTELHHLFRRWAGLTPKAFLQALTLDSARKLLRDSASVLDASYEVGLSGPGRLHDLFVTHEAMSPGEWKIRRRRADHLLRLPSLAVRHRAGDGDASAALPASPSPIPARKAPRSPTCAAAGRRRTTSRTSPRTAPLARAHLRSRSSGAPDRPLRVVLIGTDFEVRVWETLLRIPMGRATTYSDIASNIGTPKAARAVGAAVGKNPISLRGAVPPRDRQIRRAHRLSLGPDPQARHAGLGGRQVALGLHRACASWKPVRICGSGSSAGIASPQ